ncbi:MAG: thermonuclease family protein [Candidatus Omnitrophica bacterium]|nr:thermonuclease family protein [Candidatus Omnitrophota bacterium]
MPKSPSETRGYPALLRTLRAEVASAKSDIARRTVVLYWTVGRHINQFLSSQPADGSYRRGFFHGLSEDLGIDTRTLYHASLFERTYPKLDAKLDLSWSHYRYLCQLPTAAERRRWERRIIKEKISSRDLLALMHEGETDMPGGTLAEPVRGQLYHYRLIKSSKLVTGPDVMLVDCGFENCVDVPQASVRLNNTHVYRSDKQDGVYTLKASKVTRDRLYTYKAYVERVIDADTLKVIVDCGFGIRHRQTVRLKGIDAPELKTIPGTRAAAWVKNQLKECPFIILRTHKTDKYARYLGDVFYLAHEQDADVVVAQGDYLNGGMVEIGHAQIWEK